MAKRQSISISSMPEQARLLAAYEKSGRYGSKSEIVRQAMNLFDDEQQAAKARRDAQFEKARADIQLGADRLDQGRTVDGDIFSRRSACPLMSAPAPRSAATSAGLGRGPGRTPSARSQPRTAVPPSRRLRRPAEAGARATRAARRAVETAS